MPITYPRPCPICGTKIKNRGNFFRHKKYCGTNVKVPCLHCDKTFSRKDKMVAHVKKFHSEAAKRKAEESAELLRLELLHASKVPHLSEDSQTGGAVSTRGTKRSADDGSPDVKELKPEVKPQEENEEYDEGPTPLFVANVTKLGPAKRWKQNAVVNQKFIMTLDQQRPPKESEDLNICSHLRHCRSH